MVRLWPDRDIFGYIYCTKRGKESLLDIIQQESQVGKLTDQVGKNINHQVIQDLDERKTKE